MDMHYPREFNATHHWTYKIILTRAKVHFTMLQQAVLTDVMADFGNDLGCEVPLAQFVPTHYTLEIRSEDGLTLGKRCVVMVVVVVVVVMPVLRVCAFVACVVACGVACLSFSAHFYVSHSSLCATLLYVSHFSVCHTFDVVLCAFVACGGSFVSFSAHCYMCHTFMCRTSLHVLALAPSQC